MSDVVSFVQEHFISFEYKDDGSYIEFSKASPGQQAAALLELLLNQDAGTLIIDQPEDDLDNKKIMAIAKRIRTSKSRRQIIFATHNANILVNGDADKIIVLSGTPDGVAEKTVGESRIGIEHDGSIETPSVRTHITTTLEGGADAFRLRARKYQLHD